MNTNKSLLRIGFAAGVAVLLVMLVLCGARAHEQEKETKSKGEAKLDALVEKLKAVKPTNEALRQELLKMREEDQRLRMEGQKLWEAKGPDSPEAKAVWEKQGLLDAKNQARLAEIVAQHGWPGVKLVGLGGADAAFLIVQHAELAYQKKYLPMLKAAAKKKDALPLWAAMLEDRVLVGEGKPQIYGSQLRMPPGSTKWELCPIANEEHVDERRAAMGLGPLAEYLKLFKVEYTHPKNRKRK